MQPWSTRYFKPSAVLRAEPRGKPFSAWITNSTGRSSRPSSSASSKAIRWILLYPPSGPSSAEPSQPILIGSGDPVQLLPLSAIAGLLAFECRHGVPHEIFRNEYNVQSFLTVGRDGNRLRKGVPLSEFFIQRPRVSGLRSPEPRVADACAEPPSRGNAGS